MRSDFLDTSNPYRLLAFFQFCDVANNATRNSRTMAASPNRLVSEMLVGVIESMRQHAIERAFDLINGGEFKARYPSSWSRKLD